MPAFGPFPSSRVLAQSAVAVSHTGDTNETTLATITIPGGALGVSGQVVVEALWSYTNSANNKTVRVKFGGTNYLSAVGTTTSLAQTHTRVANRTASSQIGYASGLLTAFGNSASAATTSSVDTSSDVSLLLTGQLASAGETVTLESYIVMLYPRA